MNSDSIFYHPVIGGIARGVAVRTLVHPIEVIKTHYQTHFNNKIHVIAVGLFKNGGVLAFYRGFFPELAKTCVKQAWVWPMIIHIPKLLEHYNIRGLKSQSATGLAIATVDALF